MYPLLMYNKRLMTLRTELGKAYCCEDSESSDFWIALVVNYPCMGEKHSVV